MPLILFEDEHLLVVNKPPGWNTHAPSPFAGEGVYEWLKNREPRWAKLAIIHRLDKETSGVLVFGKTSEANRSLTAQFAARHVQKKYLLLTDRKVKRDKLVAVSTIVRAGEKYVSRPLHRTGERAETRFTVVTTRGNETLVEAEPLTGRTHQIRVHAAAHGMPILGDTLYGGGPGARLFLHATALTVQHPITLSPMTFQTLPSWPSQTLAHVRQSLAGVCGGAREAIIEPALTNSWRLIHGGGDGWPGLYVEKLGDYLLAQSERAPEPRHRELLVALARDHQSRAVYHKLLTRQLRGANTTESSPQLLFGEAVPERFTVHENGLTFDLSFNEGYSVGLFLDQRENRRRLLTNYIAPKFLISHAQLQGGEKIPAPAPWSEVSVLNAFAYSCGFSVAAAKAGARTTSLDLSKKYLDWGKRNFALNGLDASQHDFIFGDAFDWMRRLAKKGRQFDCVILDPPTFSQSKETGVWRAEKDFGKLISTALPVVKSNGVLLASTNAAKLSPEQFLAAIENAVAKSRRKILQRHYVPQPPDFPISRDEPAYLKTVWLQIS